MKRLTILGVVAFVGLIVVPATVIGDPAGPPGGLDVQIVNPLPLPVTGDVNIVNPHPLPVTGNVNATVTGDVNATVTGEVNVTNLPEVQEVTGQIEVTEYLEAVILDGRCCPDSELHNVNLHFSIPEDKILILEDVTVRVLRCNGNELTPITPNQLTAKVGGSILGQFNDAIVGDGAFSGRTFNKQVKIYAENILTVNVKIDPSDYVSGVFFLGHGRLVPGSRMMIDDD